jgi:flagellar protein FlaG
MPNFMERAGIGFHGLRGIDHGMQSISALGSPHEVESPDPKGPRPAANSSPAAGPGATDQGPGAGAATPAQLKAAVASANRQLDQSNRELTFVFDDTLGRMLVKIVDRQTNTVVRQVPSEDMLAMARALSGTPTNGALLKSKA